MCVFMYVNETANILSCSKGNERVEVEQIGITDKRQQKRLCVRR